MRFITLTGVDGSGKSTQLRSLRASLEAEGKKVAYFHAVEFSLANRLARFFRGEKEFIPGRDAGSTKASFFSVMLREKFLFLDMLRFRLFRRKLAREGYDYLLSDRSFYDSVINLHFLSSARIARIGIVILERLLPRADRAFYLDLEAEAILSRERVPEQGREYLEKKISLFKEHLADWSILPIAASRPPEEIAREIREKIR